MGDLGDKLREAVTAEQPPAPSVLYHFTDLAGLVGIISKRQLWASVVTGLNDRAELVHGLNTVRAFLAEIYGSNDRFANAVAHYLSPESMEIPGRGSFLPFIVSFCEREDVAAQWLHYGRYGTGCALAFAPTAFPTESFTLRQVVYDAAVLRRSVERAARVGASRVARLGPPGDYTNAVFRYITHTTALHLWEAAACFKHAAFGGECEWRLITHEAERTRASIAGETDDSDGGPPRDQGDVSVPPTEAERAEAGGDGQQEAGEPREVDLEMKFRLCGGRVVPYLEVPFSPLPLTSIVLGAASVPGLEKDSGIKYLLARSTVAARAQSGPVPIRRSDVLVRP